MMEETDENRILTNDQTKELETLLHNVLRNDKSEDASDILDYSLAMVSNGKTSKYIVDELKSMEMDICAGSVADEMGSVIDSFLRGSSTKAAPEETQDKSPSDPSSSSSSSKMKTLKATRGENALTMSGALGTNKKTRNYNTPSKQKQNALTESGALGTIRKGEGPKKSLNKTKAQPHNRGSKSNNKKDSGIHSRSIASEAFQRLSQRRDHDRIPASRGRGGGRAGRGGIKGGDRRSENRTGDGRGEKENGRGFARQQESRKRQNEYISNNDRDPSSGRSDRAHSNNSARGSNNHEFKRRQSNSDPGPQNNDRKPTGMTFRNRGGKSNDFGRGNFTGNGFKRTRISGDQGEHSNNRNATPHNERDLNKRSNYNPNAVGRRNSQINSNSLPIKGSDAKVNQTDKSTLEAAKASPSPLIASEFGSTKLSYGGRGHSFRGRGFRGRGRGGRGFPGRSDVVAMLAAKTWTRSKETTEKDSSTT